MERLTKRNPDGSVGISEFRYYNYEDFQKLASKLADYEDKEENGLILELPCKLGDTIYAIVEECEGDPYECYHTCDACSNRSRYIVEEKFYIEHMDGIGEWIFLTKAEAETKLEEIIKECQKNMY